MLFLATDLDGTFLGGREADRLTLYRALAADPGTRLVFVTGRGVESVLPLLSDPLIPGPEFIIADVGATILSRERLVPVQPIQSEIESRWVGAQVIVDALKGMTGLGELVRQPVPQERRCSFFLDDPGLLPEVRRRLAHLECEILYSADRYLDILPAGVSKGGTLRKLVDYLGVLDRDVLVAGDTLNDYSLFTQGFRGVVVGHSERALRNATVQMPGVLQATSPGAGGILEAIGTMEYPLEVEPIGDDAPTGEAQLVLVYHRLPFEEYVVGSERARRAHSSPNGIIPTLLGLFEQGRRGSWVAWSIQPDDGPASIPSEPVDERRYPHLNVAKIPLAAQDVDRFYKQFSKEAFWPVIFSFADKATFSASDWDHFVGVNRLFAERAAAEADYGATVMIHDYNHWMVPAFLRQLRPDLRIGFFHHTSFPPAEVFNVIPWADQIVGSLAQCDYIGFHIPRYVANFVDVLQSHMQVELLETESCAPRFRVHGCALAVGEMPVHIRSGERSIVLAAHPVGVNVGAIRDILASTKAQEHYRKIRERFAGMQMILSVGRLDYVKGPIQKLEAFESLLESHPELCGRVALVLVTTPPAPGMVVYEETRKAVDEAVGRVNGRYRTLEWAPVHYLFRSLPFEEVIVYSAAADVAWITPLRDGLNLVTKEYVVAQDAVGGAGALVVSEFAGASVELHGAVLTNPYDPEGLRDDLYRAVMLSEDERRHRMLRLIRIVESSDVIAWGQAVLRATADPEAASR